MRAFLLAIGLVLSAVAVAGTPEVNEERALIFAKFDHTEHEASLKRGGLPCHACHQISAKVPADPAKEQEVAVFREPPAAVCHLCHAPGEGDLGAGGGVAAAPHRCDACHADLEQPESHAIGWLDLHGLAAHEGTGPCLNCHVRADCTDCHDRRQTAGQKVHDRSWLTVHGIAAWANPAGCDTCHAPAECTSCHESGAGWGRKP